MQWVQLTKCKKCEKPPYILPAGRKKVVISCDCKEGEFSTAEEWNKFQESKEDK